jgi:hypothetical protein
LEEIEGDFTGEVVLDPIKYSKILTKVVIKNNETSGKITLPYEYINEKVVILFPIQRKKKEEGKK